MRVAQTYPSGSGFPQLASGCCLGCCAGLAAKLVWFEGWRCILWSWQNEELHSWHKLLLGSVAACNDERCAAESISYILVVYELLTSVTLKERSRGLVGLGLVNKCPNLVKFKMFLWFSVLVSCTRINGKSFLVWSIFSYLLATENTSNSRWPGSAWFCRWVKLEEWRGALFSVPSLLVAWTYDACSYLRSANQ